MDRTSYQPPTRKRKLSRKHIKQLQKNMSRVNEVHTIAQAYQDRESNKLPSLEEMIQEAYTSQS